MQRPARRARQATRARRSRSTCFATGAKAIGAYAAALGGLDSLVFTGGIGEHAAAIVQQITDGLGFLSIKEILTIPTDEEL